MTLYAVIQELNHSEEFGDYVSFGISVSDGSSQRLIHDVFLDKKEAETCVNLFNDQQLAEVHLEQVLDEYLQVGI